MRVLRLALAGQVFDRRPRWQATGHSFEPPQRFRRNFSRALLPIA
jgi:hypothetical protein